MNIPEKIFKAYDIRGLYPSEINEENVVPIVRAIFVFLSKDFNENRAFKFVLARDMRVSSPALFEAASKTLLELGAEVIDIGIVSTPTFYFAVRHLNYDGGFTITASHNPKEYNGIKIVKNTAEGILKIGKSTGMDEVKRLSLEGVDISSNRVGSMSQNLDIINEEVEFALEVAGKPNIGRFKIVADAANAMGGLYIEAIAERLGLELVKMNFELDGTFPVHQADPMQPKNLVDLRNRLIVEKADIGFAPDGDGDRLFILDETGAVVSPSIITSIVAKELLKVTPGSKFITDIKYNLNTRQIVEELGGEFIVTKTGHAFISEAIQKTGAIFAGEASAHYFFKATGGGESQMPVIAIILGVMTRENKKLSEVAKEYKRAFESGEINFEAENGAELMQLIQEEYSDGEVSTLDGIAISYPDRRISLRSSNTEPLLRLNIEALDEKLMEQTKEEVINLIETNSVKPEVSHAH